MIKLESDGFNLLFFFPDGLNVLFLFILFFIYIYFIFFIFE